MFCMQTQEILEIPRNIEFGDLSKWNFLLIYKVTDKWSTKILVMTLGWVLEKTLMHIARPDKRLIMVNLLIRWLKKDCWRNTYENSTSFY